MRPLLELVRARGEVSMPELRTELAQRFGLSETDLAELLPSGHTTVWINRVNWAKTHLYKAGVVDTPSRGRVKANARTSEVLAKNSGDIGMKILMTFPEYVAWRELSSSSARERTTEVPGQNGTTPHVDEILTPREVLEQAHDQLRRELEASLLELVKQMDPTAFEKLVVELVGRLGYGGLQGSAQHLGKSGDGGVDGVVREDRLGLDHIYLQAKRWEGQVSRPQVQAFVGSLEGFRANKGIFITTSTFSRDARDYVTQIQKRIVLIDGSELVSHMWDTNLGTTSQRTYETKSVDTDFFESDFD